jgi:hypothetical protein
MKKILGFTAILLMLASAFTCRKDNDMQHDVQQDIVGMWIKETTYSDGTGDTIVFTNDFRVEKYFKYYEEEGCRITYKLKVDTIFISVNSDNHMVELSFKYSITGNKLTIFSFTYPFSAVAVERKDVVFIRSQTN